MTYAVSIFIVLIVIHYWFSYFTEFQIIRPNIELLKIQTVEMRMEARNENDQIRKLELEKVIPNYCAIMRDFQIMRPNLKLLNLKLLENFYNSLLIRE